MTARFGPAGNCEDFYEAGYKATIQAPQYVKEKGLDAYEIQFGRGVRMSQPTAETLGENARQQGVSLSIHALIISRWPLRRSRNGTIPWTISCKAQG